MKGFRAVVYGLQPATEYLATHAVQTTLHGSHFLLAVAIQETNLEYRFQIGGGPARGLLQFERAGVIGIMRHGSSRVILRDTCAEFVVPFSADGIHDALSWNDMFQFVCGRLLLLTDPHPVPATQGEAWEAYQRLWRPGRPRPEKWPVSWRAAEDILDAQAEETTRGWETALSTVPRS